MRESSSSVKIDVQLSSNKPILISLNQCVLGRSLYLKIKKVTGISKLIQMIFYRGSLIQPHIPLRDYGLKDGECVSLLVKGVGGGGDGGSGDSTFMYTNCLLKTNFQLK